MNSQFPNLPILITHTTNPHSKHSKSRLSSVQSITHSTVIHQQSQSISPSCKNASEKLLQLEKQLKLQSIYNEKQRALIDILKSIVNENIDDTTILTYISTLEEELGREDQQYQIGTQLQQIKIMIDRKNSMKRKNNQQKDLVIDFKKQIKQLKEVQKELMEDFEKEINEKDLLETQIKEFKKYNLQLKLKVQDLTSYQQKNQDKLQVLSKENSKLKHQQEELHQQLRKVLEIQQKNNYEPKTLIQNIQIKLNRYQDQCKELSARLKGNSQSRFHSIIKLFLSTEAIKIVEEYQKTHQDCLLKQLQNLCRLEQSKKAQLENCQQEMWRWRVKSLRSEDTWASSQRKNNYGTKTKENSIEMCSREVSQFKIQE